jgi:micrococcal nuclease
VHRRTRRRISWLAVVGLAVAAAVGCGAPASTPPTTTRPPTGATLVPVIRVIDGDTIHVSFEGHDERVRFIGVDTPEIAHGGQAAECYGGVAADYLRHRLDGAKVRLAFDIGLKDRYGRLLAYVYLGDELVNLTLVRDGYAVALAVRPDTRMAESFERAELGARSAGRGLWSACPRPGS